MAPGQPEGARKGPDPSSRQCYDIPVSGQGTDPASQSHPASLEPGRPPSSPRTALAVAGIIIAGVVVYANSFGGKFYLDDLRLIEANSYIRSFRPIWQYDKGAPLRNRTTR
ncbi:hypothetical protein LCGC14_1412610 [marine sediment metagenome]|uniref:Uncharacterized protein n=1 Tax=marine sediment metagenome TaxID=412755 RepID=A0A0F9M963_9ZZZZ